MIFTYTANTATLSFDSSGYASTVVFYVHSNDGDGAVDWVTPHHVIPGRPNGGTLVLPATVDIPGDWIFGIEAQDTAGNDCTGTPDEVSGYIDLQPAQLDVPELVSYDDVQQQLTISV